MQVLVGDPQELLTTVLRTKPVIADIRLIQGPCDADTEAAVRKVLSQRAQDVNMERSLFERLQKQGCPVSLLSVQYRMHPSIRQYPSNHFYEGRLQVRNKNAKDWSRAHLCF